MLFPISFFLFFPVVHSLNLHCANDTFGTCSVNNHCKFVAPLQYRCEPCPLEAFCNGDGYSRPLSNHTETRYYIVSEKRELSRLKRIGRIVKTGIKVAAIVKTGGVAGLKAAAAAKLKELAIKKGI